MDWVSLIAELILPALCALLTAFVVPLLRESRVFSFVKAAVEAAEQIFGDGFGEQKYGYVRKLLTERFAVTGTEAERLIEAAVYELRRLGDAVAARDADPDPVSRPNVDFTRTDRDKPEKEASADA